MNNGSADVTRKDQLMSVGKPKLTGDVYDWLVAMQGKRNDELRKDGGSFYMTKKVELQDIIRAILRERMEEEEMVRVESEMHMDDDDVPF